MKKMRSSCVFVALVACVVMFCMAGLASAAEITLKFAGQSPADHPCTKLMEEIAQEIAEKSDGRIEVKIYPASQLGDYTLIYEEQIRGTMDMSCMSVPSQFDPRLELVYINGYVRGYKDVARVFSPEGWLFKKMDELNSRLGVKLLGFYIEGMIGTGTTKPAVDPINPAVNKEVLVRVPNMDVYKLAADAMGYQTVTIPWADVYQSMQTGVCSGMNGFSVSAAYTILGDVLKYWYMTNYSLECLNYMISGKVWNELSEADQKIIQDAVSNAAAKSIVNAQKEDERYMELMRQKGIQVFTYAEEDLTPIAEACASTWPKLEKNMGKELMDEFRKELAPK